MLLGFVLKVIGLILLVLFCLLFLLLCLVLLVPIRYEASGYKKKGETPEMACQGDLHWLFHLVQLHAGIYGRMKQLDVRILWLHPFSPRTKRAKSEEKQEKESEEKQQMGRETESEEKRATERETESKERQGMAHETLPLQSETLKKSENFMTAEEAVPKHETVVTDGAEEVLPKAAGPAASAAEEKKEEMPAEPHKNKKIKDAPQRKTEKRPFTDKIMKIFRSLPDKIKRLCEKERALQMLLTEEENQDAMRLLLSRVQYLLRHLGFRKLEGELTAGFDDPAMMGRIMGVASLFYPLFSDSFCITPVFDHAVCEGRFELKGHIRLIHIVLVLLQLLLNKKIRHFIFQHL